MTGERSTERVLVVDDEQDIVDLLAIRATRRTPVILLTARGEEIDRLLGFELGADDYVRLWEGAEVQRMGPIEIDSAGHRVTVQGAPIHLTIAEFRLLADLVRSRGRVRSREALLAEVWGYNSDVMSRTVDTHVRRLRDKLGPAAEWLQTVRGVGYRLQDPAEE